MLSWASGRMTAATEKIPFICKSLQFGHLVSRTTPSHTGRQRNAVSLALLFLQNPAENLSCLLNTGCWFSW